MPDPTTRDRWASRDLPVLIRIVDDFEAGEIDHHSSTSLAEALDMDQAQVLAAVRNLERGGYVTEVQWMMGEHFFVSNVSERALRVTGIWPDAEQQADRLLWLLEQKVEQAPTPEDRSRWVRIRDSIGAAGRDLTVELAAAMTMRTIGG